MKKIAMMAVCKTLCIAVAAFSLCGCGLFHYIEHDPEAKKGFADAAPIIEALEKYHADTGEYPETLAQLLPKYSQTIPAGFDYGIYKGRYGLHFGFTSYGVNTCGYDPDTKKWYCHGYL